MSAQSRCMDVSNLLQRDQMNRLIDRTFKALVKSGNCADQEKEGNPEDQQLPPDTIKVPPRIKNIPLTVNLSLYIEQLSQIMDLEMTFRIDFYIVQVRLFEIWFLSTSGRIQFRICSRMHWDAQRWTAQRIYCNLYKKLLSERNIRLSDYNSSGDMLQMNSDFFKFFWLPDSYIANAKSTEMQSATLSTRSLQVYVTPNTKSYGGDGVGGGEVCQMLLSGR